MSRCAAPGFFCLQQQRRSASFILEGNWLFTVLVGVVLFSFVGVLFFNRTRLIAHAHDLKNRRAKRFDREDKQCPFAMPLPKDCGFAP